MSQIKKMEWYLLKVVGDKKVARIRRKKNSLSTTLVVKKKVIKIQYIFSPDPYFYADTIR